MRILPGLALALLLFGASCGGGDVVAVDGRHHEEGGDYSFLVPGGWELRDLPGFQFKIAAEPGTEDFAANLNVVSEKFGGSLADYVAANRANVERIFEDCVLTESEVFRFDSGAEGTRFRGAHVMQGRTLEQSWYVLPDDGRYLIMTGTRLATQDPALDAIFDAAARSLRVE